MLNREMISAIVTLTFARLIVNVGRRFAVPFLPAIARGLDTPLVAVQQAIGVSEGAGIFSPLFGPLAERYGRKNVMLGALALLAAACGLGALLPRFWLFAGVMLAIGVGKMIFDPALLAYIGDRVPYARRGLAIGANELSWAGGLIVSAPLAGFLLERATLQAVFAVIAILFVIAFVVVALRIPSDRPSHAHLIPLSPFQAWHIVRPHRVARAALGYSLLLSMANEVYFINYGAWMERSFDLGPGMLGIATIVIALAEVTGEVLVMAFADRFGKRRLSLVGAVGAGIGYMLMPFLTFHLAVTLVGLFVLFVCFETAIVASIPLFTEILPDARGIMMTSNAAAYSVGRFSGAFVGGLLLTLTGSFTLIAGLAFVVGTGAFFVLRRYVPEHSPHDIERKKL